MFHTLLFIKVKAWGNIYYQIMTIANTFASKLVVAFVAIAMAFSLSFAPAHAATEEELQQQINDLLATIAALQAQLGGGVSTASVCPYTWTRDLSNGSSGVDVMRLQQYLNSDPETRVAASGVGSAGQETEFYGPLTGAAVAKYQTKYRADVLTPLGLVNATQFFGPSTRAHANGMCTTAPADDDANDDDDDANDDDDDDGPLSGGEADIDDFDAKSGDDTDLQEGQNDGMVMDFEFDVEDGDVRVSRIDVVLDPGASNTESDPWDTFEEVAIYVDGEEVARMDTDEEEDWEENPESTLSGEWRVRFSGLDVIIREDNTFEGTVALSVADGVDGVSGSTVANWDILIGGSDIRAVDSEGIDVFTGDVTDTVAVEISQKGDEDELTVKSSSEDPDATTLELESSERSDWLTVFAFDLDTEDSENDIEIETINVDLNLSSSTYAAVVNDARLVNDAGESYDDFTAGAKSDGATLAFDPDNNEWVIPAGDRQTVELQVRFEQLALGNEGITASGTASSTGIGAEGSDDLTQGTQKTGSATGEDHTLRTSGGILDPGSTSETFKENNDASTTDNEGVFEIKFDVTAFETDLFIPKSAARGTTLSTQGVNYVVEDATAGGTATTTGTVSSSLTSTADTETGVFKVDEGETETFTLNVEFDPALSAFYQLQLHSVNFDTGSFSSPPGNQQLALPAEDYETDSLSIDN